MFIDSISNHCAITDGHACVCSSAMSYCINTVLLIHINTHDRCTNQVSNGESDWTGARADDFTKFNQHPCAHIRSYIFISPIRLPIMKEDVYNNYDISDELVYNSTTANALTTRKQSNGWLFPVRPIANGFKCSNAMWLIYWQWARYGSQICRRHQIIKR